MPGRNTHIPIGVFCSICASIFLCNGYSMTFVRTVEFSFLGVVGAVFASLLPDIIEQPSNYRHRGFFHSKRIAIVLTIAMSICLVLFFIVALSDPYSSFEFSLLSILTNPDPLHPYYIWFVFSICLGYLLHLAVDSQTKMGLPD
jgi:CDP-diglyceride synthetase